MKWIKPSERLPKAGKPVIIKIKNKFIDYSFSFLSVEYGTRDGRRIDFKKRDNPMIKQQIVAWLDESDDVAQVKHVVIGEGKIIPKPQKISFNEIPISGSISDFNVTNFL